MAAGQTSRQQAARTTVTSSRPRPVTASRPAAQTPPATTQRRSKGNAAARAGAGKAGPARATAPDHLKEIVALLLLGVAVFLFVVLLSGGAGGVLGRGSAAGLAFAFGKLALLVPLALVLVAVTTVFEMRLWRSYWFIGGLVFLFGLLLLVAAGTPPFGGHGMGYFTTAEFGRAGGLGGSVRRAPWAGRDRRGSCHRLGGGRRASAGHGHDGQAAGDKYQAAAAVRDSAERGMTVARNRSDEAETWVRRCSPGTATERAWTSATGGGRIPLGPIDLVGDDATSSCSHDRRRRKQRVRTGVR
jgi:hypothetical protein